VNTNTPIPQYSADHYAVVDLGSNSFHLLITRLIETPVGQSMKIVNKVKQKVRLAAGLNDNLYLTEEAILRGLNCLKIFSQHLASIQPNNIIIVATAALRIAKNNDVFFHTANKILPKDIKLLSGEQEAQTIYAGVMHSPAVKKHSNITKKLVIDIGGASTEIIVGEGNKVKKLVSLDIGCVSFLSHYFADGLLTLSNFECCTHAAKKAIDKVSNQFIGLGWQSAVGSSGTMQAMIEILQHHNQEQVITLTFLLEIQKDLIACKTIDNIHIPGLRADRKAVLASGLSILIALFRSLDMQTLELSGGALREGLLFELAPQALLDLDLPPA
jgi:exopolyphosphatase/guanosine-5'-triphosphate,3'-diphosphate pyrophosphatase